MVPVAATKAEGAPLILVSSSSARELVEATLVDSPAVDRQLSLVWAALRNLNGADQRTLLNLDVMLSELLLSFGDAVAAAALGAGGAS